jgi:hypothetical protein
MPETQRTKLSEAMDVTLLEKHKEQSMNTFFEMHNVIRMSFIEMQYMKSRCLPEKRFENRTTLLLTSLFFFYFTRGAS